MDKTRQHIPFPATLLELLITFLIAVFITVGFMIAVPLDNAHFFSDSIENQWFSDFLIFFILFLSILVITIIVNRARKTRFVLFSKHCHYDWKLLLLVLGTTLIVFYTLITPLDSLLWGVEPSNVSSSWVVLLSALIIGPSIEEILFRGIALNGLLYKQKPTSAIISTALLFALVHLDYHKLFSAFVLGLILGVLYIRTDRNLLFCIISHIFVNVVSYFGLFDLGIYQNQFLNIVLVFISLLIFSFLIFFSFSRRNESSAQGDSLVTVTSVNNEVEAQLLKAKLAAAGIESIIVGETSPYPDLNQVYPIRILVNKQNATTATRIIMDCISDTINSH